MAKCRALNEEGITAYHWAGSYRVPPATVTGSIQVKRTIQKPTHLLLVTTAFLMFNTFLARLAGGHVHH